jgi:hypothetical protein
MPPDIYLVRMVFDVLQLISRINRHMQTLVRAMVGSPGNFCIGCKEPMATQFEIRSKHPIKVA